MVLKSMGLPERELIRILSLQGRAMIPVSRPVYQIVCLCKSPIRLPRRSPLGRFVDLGCQYMDTWPATFLCINCGRVSEYSVDSVQDYRVTLTDPSERLPDLWRIDFECAHENCGRMNTIYTSYSAGFPEAAVKSAVFRKLLTLQCSAGHSFEVNERTLRKMEPFEW